MQDTWIRWHGTDRSAVRNANAFLTTASARLALNVADSARARHEATGGWMPEPVDAGADPTIEAERDEALELVVRTLSERLSPTERAVFVLREAFDYPYRQVADVLGLSEANARQLLVRARARLASGCRLAAGGDHQRLLAAFTAAGAPATSRRSRTCSPPRPRAAASARPRPACPSSRRRGDHAAHGRLGASPDQLRALRRNSSRGLMQSRPERGARRDNRTLGWGLTPESRRCGNAPHRSHRLTRHDRPVPPTRRLAHDAVRRRDRRRRARRPERGARARPRAEARARGRQRPGRRTPCPRASAGCSGTIG